MNATPIALLSSPGPAVRKSGLVLLVLALILLSSVGWAQQREIEQLSPEKLKEIQTEKLEEQYFPALEFLVLEITGEPNVLRQDAEEWEPLEEDELLKEGARISTLDGETVQLKIPGISLIELEENSEIVLEELVRNLQFGEGSGVFEFGLQPNASHSVKIKALDGEVQNSISDRIDTEDQTLEYELETPQSVAGLRGTTFNCSVSQDETECSVYEGRIHLASLQEPGLGRILESGFKSTVKKEDSRPDTPSQITIEQTTQLQGLLRQGRKKLRLEPFVGNLVIAGKEPKRIDPHTYQTEVNYYKPRTIKLLGEARAREPGSTLKSVNVKYNGQNLPVPDRNEWEAEIRPDTVYPGQRRSLNFEIQATDDTGMQSLPQRVTVDLVNRDEPSPIPRNYKEATVNVEVTSIGRQDVKDATYPFHLFIDDLERGKNALRIVGEAGGYNPVENVAYSLDEGVTWDLADGTFQWEFGLPVNPGVKQGLRPRLRAWTRKNTIGSVHEAGPYIFHPKTFSRHLSDQLRRFWQAFVNQNIDGIKNNISDNVRLEDQKSGIVVYRQQLLQSFRELFAVSSDMSVTTEIREASAGRNRGNMTYSLEINARRDGTEKRFKILSPYVYMGLKRGTDGRFLVRRITDLLTKQFMHSEGYETVRFGQGYNMNELRVSSRQKRHIHFNHYGENPEDWTLRVGNGVFKGGVLNLGSTKLANAYPLPELGGSNYSSWVYIQPGNLYAFNGRTTDGMITSFFRFKELTRDSLKVQVYTVDKLPGF